jgi:uncharacterized membrane protein/2-hydroxychromene-2-carboxylate isomerase
MPMSLRFNLCRGLAVLALGGCGALLADHFLVRPVFCGFDSGCDDVLSSVYGRPGGVPLPVLGIGAFGVFLGLTLLPKQCVSVLIGPMALSAGAVGLTLILAQLVVLRQTCGLCLLVDGCAVGLAIVLGPSPSCWAALTAAPWIQRCGWLIAAVLVVLAPGTWAWLRPMPAVPEQVKAFWSEDNITVVEVTDFDCPHCRQAHAVVDAFLAEQGERIRFIRLAAAMPQHADARPTARAYLAAQAQGQGDAMATRLFAAARRASEDCRQLAQALGLDMPEYDRAVSDPVLDAAIDATNAWAKTAGPGLPLLWVQEQSFYGVPNADALRRACRRSFTRITGGVHQFDTNGR